MKKILNVIYKKEPVGSLVMVDQYRAAFQYADNWIKNGFSISPFKLPLSDKLYIGPSTPYFDGLHGVFQDSLPDGWGRLLVDRMLKKQGINPQQLSPVERLAIVGNSGMGALCYEPEFVLTEQSSFVDIDTLAEECKNLLEDKTVGDLDALFLKGGSSGGARPKAFITMNEEAWIVKFPNSQDSKAIGKQEYDYALCAKRCGIEMEEVKLVPSKIYPDGIFATKRFDRHGLERLHMISVCGLVESSHRIPALDYTDLVKITHYLCKNNEEQLKLFRLMCFNVFAHNRDDHSKNFTYIYNENENRWSLSPAYDLTYSNSFNGWHATTINGNGDAPNLDDILSVAKLAGINLNVSRRIATEIQATVVDYLGKYL